MDGGAPFRNFMYMRFILSNGKSSENELVDPDKFGDCQTVDLPQDKHISKIKVCNEEVYFQGFQFLDKNDEIIATIGCIDEHRADVLIADVSDDTYIVGFKANSYGHGGITLFDFKLMTVKDK